MRAHQYPLIPKSSFSTGRPLDSGTHTEGEKQTDRRTDRLTDCLSH